MHGGREVALQVDGPTLPDPPSTAGDAYWGEPGTARLGWGLPGSSATARYFCPAVIALMNAGGGVAAVAASLA